MDCYQHILVCVLSAIIKAVVLVKAQSAVTICLSKNTKKQCHTHHSTIPWPLAKDIPVLPRLVSAAINHVKIPFLPSKGAIEKFPGHSHTHCVKIPFHAEGYPEQAGHSLPYSPCHTPLSHQGLPRRSSQAQSLLRWESWNSLPAERRRKDRCIGKRANSSFLEKEVDITSKMVLPICSACTASSWVVMLKEETTENKAQSTVSKSSTKLHPTITTLSSYTT